MESAKWLTAMYRTVAPTCMAPQEFFDRTADYQHTWDFDEEKIPILMEKIGTGVPMDLPVIIYEDDGTVKRGGVNGRHRSVAAKRLGIKNFLVLIARDEDYISDRHRREEAKRQANRRWKSFKNRYGCLF